MSEPPVTITWIGHATVLIDIGGFRIVTDPIITSRVAHLRRRVEAPMLADIDVVLLSHLHMDHFHVRSLRRVLDRHTRVVVPRGATPLLKTLAVQSHDEVVAGDRLVLREQSSDRPAVTVTVVPADHSNRRGPHSRLIAEPVGFIVHCGDRSVYFAGDTDLFEQMHELGEIDIALLPIWGWGPTLGERHLDPARAAEAASWIDPVRIVPIHWGTYTPISPKPGAPAWLDNPIVEFTEQLELVGLDDRLLTVRPGGTFSI